MKWRNGFTYTQWCWQKGVMGGFIARLLLSCVRTRKFGQPVIILECSCFPLIYSALKVTIISGCFRAAAILFYFCQSPHFTSVQSLSDKSNDLATDITLYFVHCTHTFTNYSNCKTIVIELQLQAIKKLPQWWWYAPIDPTSATNPSTSTVNRLKLTLRVHVPPFLHGCVAHGCSTISQRSPDRPSVHVQRYRSGAVFSHVPPCKQGSWVPQ